MVNQVILVGRLAADPETKIVKNGMLMCRFTVAVTTVYGKDRRRVDFIDVVAWQGLGSFVKKFFAKGQMIVVNGNLQVSHHSNREGRKVRTMTVHAINVHFGETKRAKEQRENFYRERELQEQMEAGYAYECDYDMPEEAEENRSADKYEEFADFGESVANDADETLSNMFGDRSAEEQHF